MENKIRKLTKREQIIIEILENRANININVSENLKKEEDFVLAEKLKNRYEGMRDFLEMLKFGLRSDEALAAYSKKYDVHTKLHQGGRK